MNPGEYRKAIIAAGTLVAEVVALWSSAPAWVVALAGFLGSIGVYWVPNDLKE